MNPQPLLHGQVVAAFGRHYLVETRDGRLLTCYPRGKKSLLACGDQVAVAQIAADQGAIEAIDPRRSLLYRSDQYRQKLIAANATQMVVVLAAVPSFFEELLTRCLLAAQCQSMSSLIVLNKFDLVEESRMALERLQLYVDLGYTVLPLTAKRDVAPLRRYLEGHISVLVGQSGMGKSTIVNSLRPEAAAKVGDISVALDSGRHTTTHARLYRLDATSALIDSPGMQMFGLAHLTRSDLEHAFVEFRPLLGQCKFNDCCHASEPGCALREALGRGEISERRFALYRKIADELARARPHAR